MKKHRLDPISLLFGLAVIILGFTATNSRLGTMVNDRPDRLVPVLLLVVGLAAVAVAGRRSFQDVDRAGDDEHDGAQ
ncbi:MAG: hypothetical protein ABI949_02130 [Ilumatobacteraceae bacterium]